MHRIVPFALLSIVLAAGTCSQDEQAQACAAARLALAVAMNHGTEAEELAPFERDVAALCPAGEPAVVLEPVE